MTSTKTTTKDTKHVSKQINNYISSFLSNYIEEDGASSSVLETVLHKWNDSTNQASLTKTLSALDIKKGGKKTVTGPKKNKSSYIVFCQEVRQGIMDKNPLWKPADVAKEMGKQWLLVKEDAVKLAKYQKIADEDKKRYLSEKSTFVAPKSDSVSVKKVKDKNKPKKGLSTYMLFCKEQRDKVKSELGEGSSVTDISKELGKRWNLIKGDPKKIDKYVKMAATDKVRYEDQMKTYSKVDGVESTVESDVVVEEEEEVEEVKVVTPPPKKKSIAEKPKKKSSKA